MDVIQTRVGQGRIVTACVVLAVSHSLLIYAYAVARCDNQPGDHVELKGSAVSEFVHVMQKKQLGTCSNGFFILAMDIVFKSPLLLVAGIADYTHFKNPLETKALKSKSVLFMFIAASWSLAFGLAGVMQELNDKRWRPLDTTRFGCHCAELLLAFLTCLLALYACCTGPNMDEFVVPDSDDDDGASGSDNSTSGDEEERKNKAQNFHQQLPPQEQQIYHNLSAQDQQAFRKQRRQQEKIAKKPQEHQPPRPL